MRSFLFRYVQPLGCILGVGVKMCNYWVARRARRRCTVIRRQLVLPVEQGRVWEALTDPEQSQSWFGGRVDWDMVEGSPLHFAGEDGTSRKGRVEMVRPGRYLRYRWWDEGGEASEVSYLLEPDDDGTRLTVQ